MELQIYFSIITKRKKLIAIVFSVLFLLIVVITLLIPPKYSSTARLRVLTPISGGTNYLNFDIWYATRLMNTYASMASSTTVVDEIKKKFNLTSTPDINAVVIADSELIRITVLDRDPVLSASISNSIAEILLANKNGAAIQAQTSSKEAINLQLKDISQKLNDARNKHKEIFVPYTQNNTRIAILTAQIQSDLQMSVTMRDRIEQGRQNGVGADILTAQEAQFTALLSKIDQERAQLDTMNTKAAEDSDLIANTQREITLIEQEYTNIVNQLDQIKALQALQSSSDALVLVDRAEPNARPFSPNYLLVFILGIFISVFVAVLAAIALENFDDTYISPSQISTLAKTPLWGEIAKKKYPPAKEAITNEGEKSIDPKISELEIHNIPQNNSLKSLIISGVDDSDGDAMASIRLATEFAQTGRKTILVDGNLNAPSIHKHFRKIENDQGLNEVLCKNVSLDSAIKKSGKANLCILTAGLSDAKMDTKIDPQKMSEIIDQLQSKFSMVIIDIPSMTALKGKDDFVTRTDGVILVIGFGNSRRKNIQANINILEKLNTPLLGYVHSREEKPSTSQSFLEKIINRKADSDLVNLQ